MIDLNHKTAIVTGASSGIGRAIAMTLAKSGALVIVADLSPSAREGGPTTVDLVAQEGGRAHFAALDVTDSDAVEALTAQVQGEHGLDIFVNNAGILVSGSVLETTDEQWHQQMSVNVNGTFYGTRAAVRAMLHQGRGGKIVNVSSISGFRGNPGFAAYCASKGAVVNFTRQVSVDYSNAGININSVAPGFVTTQMTALYDNDVQNALKGQTPRGQWADPQDIANTVLFLSSDLSDHICGETIVVDGGWLVGTPVVLPDHNVQTAGLPQ
jgi:3-oxoacyl-[acyl-carrier protein] reductase/meso-butanediol dehydrogenase/(S,S)-butanediol dehydrogenase/diacetyl reductase